MHCHGKDLAPWLPYFAGFTNFTSAIPKLYWYIESQEQRILTICKQLHKLICYIDCVAEHVNIDHEDIETLKEQFQKFMESGFDDYYAEQIETWVNDHIEELYRLLVKQVFFGLTLDGHFVAYIPDSWDDIVFDTGFNYGDDTYGRLILRWAVDGSSVDQRPETNQYGVIGG